MDEQQQAVLELAALAKVPGALKIITSIRSDVPESAARPGYSNPLADPRMYVQHDVVRIEGAPGPTGERGKLRASSAEGDWCEGLPVALLSRLREWRQ